MDVSGWQDARICEALEPLKPKSSLAHVRSLGNQVARFLPALLLCIILLPNLGIARSGNARVLHFPSHSVGRVAPCKQGVYGYFGAEAGGRDAAGEVSFPKDAQVMLNLNYYGARHLQFMRSLKNDDIASLHMNNNAKGFEEIDDQTIPLWSQLTRLQELFLANSEISDAVFPALEKMPELSALSLAGTMITSNGVSSVRKLKHLNFLSLAYTRVGDEGLHSIEEADLWGLEMKQANITDRGMGYLHRQVHLHDLTICANKITDQGLAKLPAMPELIGVNLDDTETTDLGLASIIAKCPNLQTLDVKNCKLTKKGLLALSRLPKLAHVGMAGCFFSFNDLKILKRFPALKKVVLSASPEQKAAVGKLLSGIDVTVDNHHSDLNRYRLSPELFAPLH